MATVATNGQQSNDLSYFLEIRNRENFVIYAKQRNPSVKAVSTYFSVNEEGSQGKLQFYSSELHFFRNNYRTRLNFAIQNFVRHMLLKT